MTSIPNAVAGSAGLIGTWDAAGANAAALAQQRANQGNLVNWAGQQTGLNQDSNNIANTNWNQDAQNQFQYQQANYNDQQHAASLLYNQATGNAPSMADLQMQAGLGQANNSVQSAMLSQQGGVAPGLSQRNMLNAQAAQNAQIVSSGQANRAQELSTAQNNYANLLGNMGQTAAGMTQQQQAFGTQNYNQHVTNLGYQTTANDTSQALNAANSAANYAASMANVRGQSASNAGQYDAMGNLIAAGAGAMSNLSANQIQDRT
jgi:hypothetical protein